MGRPLKYAILSFKMPIKLLNFRFSEGRYFVNCDNTELKRSSKRTICFRKALLGGSVLRKQWNYLVVIHSTIGSS